LTVSKTFTAQRRLATYYVGLDIHQRSTSMKILDCNGKLVKRAEWKLPWPQLADQLKKEAPAPFAVCYKASCGYGYLYEQLGWVAQQVKAAHPIFAPFDLPIQAEEQPRRCRQAGQAAASGRGASGLSAAGAEFS
jgi:hypothetical protein